MKDTHKLLKISGLQSKLAKIKLILLDFDGVLTDNLVIHDQNGVEAVRRSRADSQAIDLLHDAGLYNKDTYADSGASQAVDLMILSRETNPVVASVARKIKVKCTQSKYDKVEAFKEETQKRNLAASEVLFMGNDLNDLECLKMAGIGVAVADSHPVILQAADYVTQALGGRGAFREVCELLLCAKDKLPY